MDSNLYQTLKTKVISGIPISKVTSWVIWNEKELTDTQDYIESQIAKLKTEIVFVGFNWATEFRVTDKEEWNKLKNWENFHTSFWPNGGDRRIKQVLKGTRFEGAYMTDLFKNMATRSANELRAMIRNETITQEVINKQIDFFVKEISSLETEQIEMYLFGNDAEWSFRKYIIGKEYQHRLMKQVKLCQKITQFSPAATNFLEWAPVQLGLKENNIGAKIYDPLWG
jgi:hypothetical protein